VLLVHEWWGLNDHIKHWADRLAADGYVALAVDLYGGKVATTRDDAMKLAKEAGSDVTKATGLMREAFDFLAANKRVEARRRAVLGWCFGGGMALQFAMAEPRLDATVIYYGRLVDDAKALEPIRGPVLGIFGNQDPSIPPKSVDAFAAAMKAAGKACDIHRYDAEHAFANPSNARYDEANATKAWAEVRKFLEAQLKTAAKPASSETEPAKK
jgi:carboxymethylenebutenolidase